MMYEYRATCLRVVDGDTIHTRVDLGLDCSIELTVRLSGIDAIELREPGGKDARAWLAQQLAGEFTLRTEKDRREKYGRYLGLILLDDGTDVNDELVQRGYARPYDGGKR